MLRGTVPADVQAAHAALLSYQAGKHMSGDCDCPEEEPAEGG